MNSSIRERDYLSLLCKEVNRTKPLGIIKKYYPESSDTYRILVTHSRNMVDKALALARLYPEMSLDLAFIGEAVMLHDVGTFLRNASNIDRHGEADYTYHGYPGTDLMRKEGYPHHTLVCERHTGMGLSLTTTEERSLSAPHWDVRPVSLEEQLTCFADKFFSETKLTKEKPANKIKQGLPKYGDETVEQFEYWCKLFLGE